MEFRLGNQQRHSITAVLLSAVVIIFGLVLVDIVSGPEVDPLGTRTAVLETPAMTADGGTSEAGDDVTAGVARSNARFALNPDVTVVEVESSTTTAVRRTTAAPAVVATAAVATTTTTSSSTEPSETSTSSTTGSTTTSTTVVTTEKPPGKPSTTVVDDETTTTKKCRGNRPGCREP